MICKRIVCKKYKNITYNRRLSSFFKYANMKEQILIDAVKSVDKFGWTTEALSNAAVKHGLPPLGHGVVKRGPVEMVEHFLKMKNDYVNQQIFTSETPSSSTSSSSTTTTNASSSSTHTTDTNDYDSNTEDANNGNIDSNNGNENIDYDKIAADERLRLALIHHAAYFIPQSQHWPAAVSLLLQPRNMLDSLLILVETTNNLHKMVYGDNDSDVGSNANTDDIGNSSGSNSTVTKVSETADRLLLAALYTMMELYCIGKYPTTTTTSSTSSGGSSGSSSSSSSVDDGNVTDRVIDVVGEEYCPNGMKIGSVDSETKDFIASIVTIYTLTRKKLIR